LQLAKLGGISEEKLMEVLRASSGNSWRVEHWEEQKKVVQNYPGGPAGIARTRAKDLSLALVEGNRLGASLPVTALVAERTLLPNDN
jgi:3-hydroxyisobutyrate dehydrogenase-like beta-hydroxyacid dehydrogenase